MSRQVERRDYLKKLDEMGLSYFKNNNDNMYNEIDQF
jgi:hypothetical protein